MNTDCLKTEDAINSLTESVIGAAYRVSNSLGAGFLEKVYENALAIELRRQGLSVQQQFPIPVRYDGELVGDFFSDLLIGSQVLVELKTCERLADIHTAQCLNYLKGTGLPICLLMNFAKPRVEVRRLRR